MFNSWVVPNICGPQLNAALSQGDEIAWAFQLNNGAVPLNLSGYTIIMTIGTPDPISLSTINGAVDITDAAAGQFAINQTSTETSEFPAGTFPYDMWLFSQLSPPEGSKYFSGQIIINPSITPLP